MTSTKTIFATSIIAALVAIGPLSTDMYLPAFPALMKAFDADISQVQYTLSTFLVGFALAQLFYGPLSDRFGRKPVLIGGMLLFIFSSIAIAFAGTIETLAWLRLLQAVGGSVGPVLGRAIVRDIHGPTEAARQFAFISTAMALAPAVAPILGGYLTIWFGWASTISIPGALWSGSNTLVCYSSARDRPPRESPRIDTRTHAKKLFGPAKAPKLALVHPRLLICICWPVFVLIRITICNH